MNWCKHCEGEIEPCENWPDHCGCSSARGWIHVGGAHACKPRSDGPYAEPAAP